MAVALFMPAEITSLNQQGALERAFHDALFPNLAFRAEAMAEEVQAHTGQTQFMTRAGLLPVSVTPLTPGTDPQPSQVIYEQWSFTLQQYSGTVDTHMPTALTSNSNLFLRNIQQLGLQAAQSINQLARNKLFQAYLSGNTVTNLANLSTDLQIHVSSVNGFTTVPGAVISGSSAAQPVPVGTTTPLPITIGVPGSASVVNANVIGVVLDNPNDPVGPGTLLLSAAVGTAFAARAPVISTYAPTIIRTGGGYSVDAIGAADTLLLQDCINAVAILRNNNVAPHDDGYYHVHIPPIANAQIFADPVFQRLNTALPEGVMYAQGFVGHVSGAIFFMNTESPNYLNSGVRTFTGPNFAQYSPGIGAETTNDNNVNIGRVVITGKGALYERYFDESQYVTEAGITGKIGEFDIQNGGINILAERIRLVIRAPIDRLQQFVSSSWSITTDFPVPSDVTGTQSGSQLFKRAVVLEYAS
jgi:hypothetical protein